MDTTVVLDEPHFKVVSEKARILGMTPEKYLQALIDADARSFDEILQPVRQGFGAMSDEQVDDLFERAQRAARQRE